jgi:predicted proteasome-type protease
VTVCVGVAVHDCLVFAADSAATLVDADPATGQSRVLNVYRHGNEVFNLHKNCPYAR